MDCFKSMSKYSKNIKISAEKLLFDRPLKFNSDENRIHYFNISNSQLCLDYIPFSYLISVEWTNCLKPSQVFFIFFNILLFFGINQCPTESQHQRINNDKDANFQYISIHPNEIKDCQGVKHFIIGLKVNERCENPETAITVTKISFI
jgi:hypothetical protein